MNPALLATAVMPTVDPIPLPAPIWLIRLLLDLTLTLHFAALYLFLGGLVFALFLNWRGYRTSNQGMIEASGVISGWLTVLMTYVINLGIPPLLFTQVLYGRALYTSSVLIGPYWIAVIPLLIGCYHLLYVMKTRAEAGVTFVWPAIGSLLAAWAIARIYSANMSLMLEPGVWLDAYRTNQSGSNFISGRGAWFRWGYMLSAGLTAAGVLVGWLGRGKNISNTAVQVFQTARTRFVLVGGALSVLFGVLAWATQTAEVRLTCSSQNLLWVVMCSVWFAGLAGGVIFTLLAGDGRSWLPLAGLSGAWIVQTAGFVECRAMVRDASLALTGFDVWNRIVAVNWSVLGLFLVLFVAALGVIAWLAQIAYLAKPKKEMLS